MPVQHAIWQVGSQPQPLTNSKLPSQQLLEDMIVSDPRILSNEWMLMGRQEITTFGGAHRLAGYCARRLLGVDRDEAPTACRGNQVKIGIQASDRFQILRRELQGRERGQTRS